MAGGPEVVPYPVEDIPDKDSLFLRVHRSIVKDGGSPMPVAYEEHDGGMSTNWSKYATAASTREQVAKMINRKTGLPRNPADYGILQFNVGQVRQIPKLAVLHAPQADNQAHTDVTGTNDAQARVKLGRIYAWAIQV
jgi:hypothetical protein